MTTPEDTENAEMRPTTTLTNSSSNQRMSESSEQLETTSQPLSRSVPVTLQVSDQPIAPTYQQAPSSHTHLQQTAADTQSVTSSNMPEQTDQTMPAPSNRSSLLSRVISHFLSGGEGVAGVRVHRSSHRRPRHLGSELRRHAREISAMFPVVHVDRILADLALTGQAELTVENILSGELQPAPPSNVPIHSASSSESANELRQRRPTGHGTHVSFTRFSLLLFLLLLDVAGDCMTVTETTSDLL